MEDQRRETSTSRRAWRFRLAALVLGLVLSLVIAEIGARVLERLAPVPTARPHVESPLSELKTLLDIPGPNVEGTWKGRYYRTNSEGFRGPEWSAEPEPGTLRIIVTGDSNTVGWGVEEGEAYTYQLQARLRRDAAFPPLEVLNIGLAGINTYRAIVRIERAIETYSQEWGPLPLPRWLDIAGACRRSGKREVHSSWPGISIVLLTPRAKQS